MYNYCCVFCARSLALFKSLDLKPLKASMGIAGNHPDFPLDASASWQTPGRELRGTARAHRPLVGRLWCRGPVETDCRGAAWLGLGLNLEP